MATEQMTLDSCIVSGPKMVTEHFWRPRRHADGYHQERVYSRIQQFTVTYKSDYYWESSDEPFPGAIEEEDAQQHAEQMLLAFVADNRLPQVGVYIADGQVTGEGRTDSKEYTLIYEIVEDLGEVDPSTEKFIAAKRASR